MKTLDQNDKAIPPNVVMLYNPTNPLNKLLNGYKDWFEHNGKAEWPI